MMNFKNILVGMLGSTICMIIFLLSFSLIMVNCNVDDKYVSIIVAILYGISILCGSIIATKTVKKNGIMNGILFGMIYIIAMYILIGFLNRNFSISKSVIYYGLCFVALSGFGGIIGANIK